MESRVCEHLDVTRNDGMHVVKTEHPFKRCAVVCFNEEKITALKKQLPAEQDLREAARRNKVLGHASRQAILHLLRMDECCVCDIAQVLDKPISTVSQHLRTLVSEGLLDYRQEGKLVFYSLSQHGNREGNQAARFGEATR